ncbi:MAG: RNA methyltransferase [Ruminococcaceae bacterium]|nr:RNA methyltransferase [Oscillospiraceae bacterium]
MIKEQSKFNNSNIFEGMPSISAVIKSIENGNSDRLIIAVYVDEQRVDAKRKEIGFLKAKAVRHGFDIHFEKHEHIDELAVGNTHGGIIAECTDKTIPLLDEKSIVSNGVYYMLEGIEDPYNFGNAIRSLYASGADGIIVGSRNWLGVAGTVARASAGASELLPAYVCDSAADAVNMFKACGYRTVCAGIRDSVSLFETDLAKPIFIVLGGEKRGISRSVLELADDIVRIDYGTNFNGSLSASASAAVFAFEVLRYNKK